MGKEASPLERLALGQYLAGRAARREIGPDTAKNHRCMLRQFAQVVAKPVDAIEPADIECWIESIADLAIATRRARFSVVKGFLHWAARQPGLLERNPMMDFVAPSQPRYVPRALSSQQVAAVLDHCPDARAILIVELMVQEGLRCCGVSSLQLGDVDLDRRMLRVKEKGGHERVLAITDEAAEAMVAYLDDEPPIGAGPLVRSRLWPSRGLRPDTISGIVTEWMWEAGIKRRRHDGVSPHALRHTCATDMLRAGAHLRDVQYVMGHAHLSTTEVYLPFLVRGVAEAMGGRRYRQDRTELVEKGA